jgi:hypothetical protein
MPITLWLFLGFRSRHLVDHRMNYSRVRPFTDNDDLNVNNLNGFTIMIKESYCKALDALHATQRNLDIPLDNTKEGQK